MTSQARGLSTARIGALPTIKVWLIWPQMHASFRPIQRRYRACLAWLLLSLFTITPAQAAQWFRTETPTFVLYASSGGRDAVQLSQQLLAFDHLLHQLTGIEPQPKLAKVMVYVIDDADAFGQLRGENYGFAGFYTATPNTIAAFIDRSDRQRTAAARRVMQHEYAHHFLLANLPGSYPAWYSEGLASYWETAQFSKNAVIYGDYDNNRARTLVLQSWLPMARVLAADWQTLPGYETELFYAQSWLAVHYFSRDPDRAARLQTYLADVANGTAVPAAFAAAFGYDIAKLDKKLIDYSQSSALTLTKLPWDFALPPIVPVALTPAENALLLPTAALRIGVSPAKSADLLTRIQALAVRFAESSPAKLRQVEAELRIGTTSKALAVLDQMARQTPPNGGDAEQLFLHGSARFASGLPATLLLEQAAAIAPDDYRILFMLGLAQPRPYDAYARSLLLMAHQWAPQVEIIALVTAQALLATGENAPARAMLLPLANNPHGGKIAAIAGRILGSLP